MKNYKLYFYYSHNRILSAHGYLSLTDLDPNAREFCCSVSSSGTLHTLTELYRNQITEKSNFSKLDSGKYLHRCILQNRSLHGTSIVLL